jgi:hypothetical protein
MKGSAVSTARTYLTMNATILLNSVGDKHWVFDLHRLESRTLRRDLLKERESLYVECICREGQVVNMIAIGQTEARNSTFSKAIQIKQFAIFLENKMTSIQCCWLREHKYMLSG